jgi:hypothetical protein
MGEQNDGKIMVGKIIGGGQNHGRQNHLEL